MSVSHTQVEKLLFFLMSETEPKIIGQAIVLKNELADTYFWFGYTFNGPVTPQNPLNSRIHDKIRYKTCPRQQILKLVPCLL